jgi:alpha-1,2-mannosyltransferase
MHAGGSLYDYLLPQNVYGYTYPPFAAFTMLPMAVTGWHAAIVISCVLTTATTLAVVYWFIAPIARRQSWSVWYAVALTLCAGIIFEPLRESFLFGQVNTLLLFLVTADFMVLLARGSRLGGIGIGLATAIKLTPGVFIVYLLVARRWREAAVAGVTALVATLGAAMVSPDSSLVFWTDAFWNTDRVGDLNFVSNQSLEGAVARMNPVDPSTLWWAAAVLAVCVVWYRRVRRAHAAGDEIAAFGLTGILGCLISPITWVHHLVWVAPALLVLLDRVVETTDRVRRRRLSILLGVSYVLLCSRIVWSFGEHTENNPFIWLLSNTYVWIGITLLVILPIRSRTFLPPETATSVVAAGTPGWGTRSVAGATSIASVAGAKPGPALVGEATPG